MSDRQSKQAVDSAQHKQAPPIQDTEQDYIASAPIIDVGHTHQTPPLKPMGNDLNRAKVVQRYQHTYGNRQTAKLLQTKPDDRQAQNNQGFIGQFMNKSDQSDDLALMHADSDTADVQNDTTEADVQGEDNSVAELLDVMGFKHNLATNKTTNTQVQRKPLEISNSPKKIQRGFMSSVKKTATSAGKRASSTLAKGAKAVVGGLQGGLVGVAKVLLGPFWDLIVAARDKKDGKEVSYMGKDNDKYIAMLQEGKDDPYGGGTDGKFATGVSWVANVLLKKLTGWVGWASLITGILGLVGPAAGAIPMGALLGVSQLLGQVALATSLASAGLNAILLVFSAIRASKLYKALPDGLISEPKDLKTREQYLLAVREFGENTKGVASGLSDAALAGAGGAALAGKGNRIKGGKSALKSTYSMKSNVKKGVKGTDKNLWGGAAKTTNKSGQTTGMYDDYAEEVGTAGAVQAGTGTAQGGADGVGTSGKKKDAGEWDGKWGDKNWGGKETATEELGYQKKDLPEMGEKALQGVMQGFIPFTILLGLWRVIYQGWLIMEEGRAFLTSKFKSLAKYLSAVGVPFGKVIGWIDTVFKKFGSIVTGTHKVLDATDKGGEKLKEDAAP